MKKLLALILMVMLLLAVCGCTSSGVYEADGVSLTVDLEACQIDDGQYTYNYSREQNGNVDKIVITYPNGVQYCVNGMDGNVFSIREYHPGDISGYISPKTLYAAIDDQQPAFRGLDGGYFLALLLSAATICLGIFFVVSPKGIWKTFSNCPVRKGVSTDRALHEIVFRGVLLIASGLLLITTVIICTFI